MSKFIEQNRFIKYWFAFFAPFIFTVCSLECLCFSPTCAKPAGKLCFKRYLF